MFLFVRFAFINPKSLSVIILFFSIACPSFSLFSSFANPIRQVLEHFIIRNFYQLLFLLLVKCATNLSNFFRSASSVISSLVIHTHLTNLALDSYWKRLHLSSLENEFDLSSNILGLVSQHFVLKLQLWLYLPFLLTLYIYLFVFYIWLLNTLIFEQINCAVVLFLLILRVTSLCVWRFRIMRL